MTFLTILKYVCLFLVVMYGFSNVVKAFRGNAITNSQIGLMTIGLIGWIILQFEVGA